MWNWFSCLQTVLVFCNLSIRVSNLLKREFFRTMLVNAVMRKLAAGKNVCNWNVLEAIRVLAVSGEKIVPGVIAACFRHAGFVKNGPNHTSTTCENILPDEPSVSVHEPGVWSTVSELLHAPCTFDGFVSTGNNVDVCGELIDAELVDLVCSNKDESVSEEEHNEEGTSVTTAVPSQTSLMEALDVLNNFYRRMNTSVTDLLIFQDV
ncbi:hypothetical protein PR048_025551 [Dryococelus australis]|uniref:Uncharacterized protein n=1 Tax=Dryococelus australis TaxID=614101 RepID=A0ABQ9GRN2_9NEOP|nr:hypothetical protein PR048_025551 [Dryococelus australis]